MITGERLSKVSVRFRNIGEHGFIHVFSATSTTIFRVPMR